MQQIYTQLAGQRPQAPNLSMFGDVPGREDIHYCMEARVVKENRLPHQPACDGETGVNSRVVDQMEQMMAGESDEQGDRFQQGDYDLVDQGQVIEGGTLERGWKRGGWKPLQDRLASIPFRD